MGKKDKGKKKGKGAEKTAAKTEKKMSNKQKKDLAAKGERDIESILAEIEQEESSRLLVKETKIDPPSPRINFSFIAHPDKDEIILFGGEYYNGQKTFIYNDLCFYTISTNSWTVLKAPNGPAPRCGHQMVATSANKGQLWLFGGEFASPSQLQFYHYKDLWLFHMFEKRWEKIASSNGPSARSGHRMVYVKKQLIVFGGFHDNTRDYRYLNDVYSFNTETYKWAKLEPVGTAPAPRSGCCMVPLIDGRILIYGGYCKEKVKKDVDKGHVFTDSFILSPDKTDTSGTKWKWSQCKLGGMRLSPRCSMTITASPNNFAYSFGGVMDVEDEENLSGHFYNDIFSLNLDKLSWNTVEIRDKTKLTQKGNDETNLKEAEEEMENPAEPMVVSDDGVFTVTVGPAPSTTFCQMSDSPSTKLLNPLPRMNCGLAIKRGTLYLYGGMIEEGDRQLIYSDFYSLDLHKLDEWKVLIENDKSQQWIESEDSSGSDNTDEESDSDEENMEMD